MEKLIEEVECVDPTGEREVVYIFQELIPAGHLKDPDAVIKGMKRAELANGQPVNYRTADSFETLDGVRLTRA